MERSGTCATQRILINTSDLPCPFVFRKARDVPTPHPSEELNGWTAMPGAGR
jgi:hypothetical protein